MKEHFRQSMAWLHTWTGLIVGWVLFFIFVTGTAGYFTDEITRWMKPELPLDESVAYPDRDTLLATALAHLQQEGQGAKSWTVNLPYEGRAPSKLSVSWEEMPGRNHDRGRFFREDIDPINGGAAVPVEARATGGGSLLYRMHYALHYFNYDVAIRIVGVCTMLMLMAIVTGVITHKKIFKDFFTFRPGKGQRSWLDAHNATSVMALPFFLMITYSGLLFFDTTYMPVARDVVYGTADDQRRAFYDELYQRDSDREPHLPVTLPQASLSAILAEAERTWGPGQVASVSFSHPAEKAPYVDIGKRWDSGVMRNGTTLRFHAVTGEPLDPEYRGSATTDTRNVFFSLHEGRFADIWVRWLYFISGLLGCVMIGTGLVLWSVKRRARHLKGDTSAGSAFGLRLVECLNVTTIAGLPVAVAAYFWANRLLPVSMADRADWEAHSMFMVWGTLLLYSTLRPLKKVWLEVLWLAVAAYALLPLLNLFTTNRHLGVTVPAGDWVLAGFDLTMFGLAALFFIMVRKVQRKWAAKAAAAAAAKPFAEVEAA